MRAIHHGRAAAAAGPPVTNTPRLSDWRCVAFCLVLLGASLVGAAGLEVAFDAANRLYEEGKFSQAAAAYEKLLADGRRSPSVLFNLGTAYFKAGQMGRAVAAFRRAEELTPRDASLRANLEFVRKKVNGEDRSPVPVWQSWLKLLTLNEGTLLAAAAFSAWMLLLALREWKPALKKRLRTYTLTAGLLTLLFTACLAASAYLRFGTVEAVVIVREAVVRFGPLEEAQTKHHLSDGAELTVLDAKDNWLQVRDATKREGWLKRDQVLLLGGTRLSRIEPPRPAPK